MGGQNTAAPAVLVNFQVSPLVKIVDVVKKRRKYQEEIDSQTWIRGTGRKRKKSRDGMNNLILEANSTMPLTKDCSTEIIIVGGEEPASNLRRGLNVKQVVHVVIADDKYSHRSCSSNIICNRIHFLHNRTYFV